MSDRSPLTQPETDLRDFTFMPLDVVRLRDSDLASIDDAEVRWVNLISWCASWHQVPAASLPDDDAALARLLGFGRDLKGWKRIRAAGGLRGWLQCSDGRLYHPVVAEKANEAWQAKLARKARTEAARKAAEEKRQRLPHGQSQADSPPDVTADVAASKGQDRDKTGTGRGIGTHASAIVTDPPSPDLFDPKPGDPPAQPSASKRVPVLELDHVRFAGAEIPIDDRGSWQLLIDHHGRERVIEAIRQCLAGGDRAFLRHVAPILRAAPDPQPESQPAPAQAPSEPTIIQRIGAVLRHFGHWQRALAELVDPPRIESSAAFLDLLEDNPAGWLEPLEAKVRASKGAA